MSELVLLAICKIGDYSTVHGFVSFDQQHLGGQVVTSGARQDRSDPTEFHNALRFLSDLPIYSGSDQLLLIFGAIPI